jgi:biopolymer transport protein ExbD
MAGVNIPQPGSKSGIKRGRGKGRRLRRRSFGLQLTSLMDILMIIVVFLLKSYAISAMSITQEDRLELPVSKASETFGEGIILIVSRDRVTIDGEAVLEFQPSTVLGADGEPLPTFELPEGALEAGDVASRGILPVYDILSRKREEFETLASRVPDPEEALKRWTGELLVQADKQVNYALLRQVMYTAGMAGYKTFRLTVEKRPE